MHSFAFSCVHCLLVRKRTFMFKSNIIPRKYHILYIWKRKHSPIHVQWCVRVLTNKQNFNVNDYFMNCLCVFLLIFVSFCCGCFICISVWVSQFDRHGLFVCVLFKRTIHEKDIQYFCIGKSFTELKCVIRYCVIH